MFTLRIFRRCLKSSVSGTFVDALGLLYEEFRYNSSPTVGSATVVVMIAPKNRFISQVPCLVAHYC